MKPALRRLMIAAATAAIPLVALSTSAVASPLATPSPSATSAASPDAAAASPTSSPTTSSPTTSSTGTSSTGTTLPGSTARWATPSAVKATVPAATPLTLTVVLAQRDAAGAEAQAAAVSDPKSAQYGAFLTPAKFAKKYSATDAEVTKVANYFTSQGATVVETSPTNTYLRVQMNATQAQSLFKVALKTYAKDGKDLQANDRDVTLPAPIASSVVAVQGLTRTLVKPAAPPSPAYVNAPPCSTYYGQKLATTLPSVDGAKVPYAVCGYVPSQLRSAYDIQGLESSSAKIDGRGVTVAIVDAYNSPTIASDANTYATGHGDAAFTKGQFTNLKPASYSYGYGSNDPVYGPDACGEQGWYGEETLDVEAVHGMAPGANVVYSGGSSCFDDDLDAAVRRIVDGHLASIITNSYGDAGEDLAPSDLAAEHRLYVQAAIEGIGVYFSAGDNGDEKADLGYRSVDYSASDPFVTAVGGSSLAITKNGKRAFETGWSTGTSTLTKGAWTPAPPGDYLYGGGGGVSTVFAQPSYQQGVVPTSISEYFGKKSTIGGTTPGRAVPDVAMDADPQTGMLVGQTQSFPDGSSKYSEYRIGGTSLASPLFAGIMALADQAAGRPHGFANYFLYSQYRTSAFSDPSSSAVKYVARVNYTNSVDASAGTSTVLRSINFKQSIFVRKGYDDVTGVGVPNGVPFIIAAAGSDGDKALEAAVPGASTSLTAGSSSSD